MDLAACRPSLAGRNQTVAGIPYVPVAEKRGSGAEFSATATVVEVRHREPALQRVRGGIGLRFDLASGLLSRAMDALSSRHRSVVTHRMQGRGDEGWLFLVFGF